AAPMATSPARTKTRFMSSLLRPLGPLPLGIVLEEPLLVVDTLGPREGGLVELGREPDRVAGARLLAITTIDAAEHVDLEGLGAALAVGPLLGSGLRLDVD